MAESVNVTQQVNVDLDLQARIANLKQVEKDLQQQIESLNKLKLKAKLDPQLDLNLQSFERQLTEHRKKISDAYGQYLKNLGATLGGKQGGSNFAREVKKKLEQDTSFFDEQGKLIEKKFQKLVSSLSQKVGLGGAIRGDSPFKAYFSVIGKDMNQVMSFLDRNIKFLDSRIQQVKAQKSEALSALPTTAQFTKETVRPLEARQRAGAAEAEAVRKFVESAVPAREGSKAFQGYQEKYAERRGTPESQAEAIRTYRREINDTINEIRKMQAAQAGGADIFGFDAQAAAKNLALLRVEYEKLSKELADLTSSKKGALTPEEAANRRAKEAMQELRDGAASLAKNESLLTPKKLLVEIEAQAKRVAEAIKAMAEIKADPAKLEQMSKVLEGLEKRAADIRAASRPKVDRVAQSSEDLRKVQERFDTFGATAPARERLQMLLELRKATENYVTALQDATTAGHSFDKEIAVQRGNLSALNDQIKGFDNIVVQFQRAFQTFIRYAVVYQALYAVQSAVKAVWTEIVNLQDALTGIKAVTQTTSQGMQDIEAAIKSVAETTAFTTDEIAKGGQTLVQAGVSVQQFGEMLRATANLASATGSSFETGAQVMSSYTKVFEDLSSTEISDALANAVNISKLNLQDLNTIANYLLSTTESYNISLNNLLAAATTLSNVGFRHSTIATGTRQAILELLSPDAKTQKALAARYRKLGINMTEEAVAAMYSGFKDAENPLLALINEMEKIGFGGLADTELSRVMDVRGESVFKALVQNKEVFVANEVALKRSGTAAAGAKTQLESLSKSWQNLGEIVVSLFYDQSKGLVSGLRDTINGLAKIIEKVSELSTKAQEAFGSSGALGSIVTGVGVTASSLLKGGSVAGALGKGAAAAVAQESVVLFAEGNKAVKAFADAVTAATAVLTISSLLFGGAKASGKAFEVKGVQGPATGKAIPGRGVFKTPVAEAATTEAATGLIAGLAAGIAGLNPVVWITLAGTLIGSLSDYLQGYVRNWLKERFPSLRLYGADEYSSTKTDAIVRQMEAEKRKATQMNESTAAAAQQKAQIDAFRNQLAQTTAPVAGTPEGTNKDVQKVLEGLSGQLLSIGSQSLESALDQVSKITGVSRGALKDSDFITKAQQLEELVAQGEAFRKQYLDQLLKAYSDLEQDPENNEGARAIIQQYNKLSDSEKSFLDTRKTQVADVEQLVNVLDKLTGDVKKVSSDTVGQQLKVLSLELDRALSASGADKVAGYAAVGMRITQAVQDNNVEFLERAAQAYVKQLADLGIDINSKLEASKDSLRKEAAAKYTQNIKLAQASLEPATKTLPTAAEFTATNPKEGRGVNQAETASLEQQIQAKLTEYVALNQQAQSAVASGKSAEDRKKLDEQITTKMQEIKNLQDTKATLAKDDVDGAEKMKQLQQSFIAGQAKVADLEEEYKIVMGSRNADAYRAGKISREIYAIKKAQLEEEKKALAENLAKSVEKAGLFNTKELTSQDLLNALSGSAGAEAMKNNEELAKNYQALSEVTSKERLLREGLTTKLKEQLDRASSKVQNVESRLQSNSERLANAREKLADLYEKQGEIESYFQNLAADLSGKKTSKRDIEDMIAASLESGSVEMAKQAAATAKGAVGNGLSKRQAKDLIESAQGAASEINTTDIIDAETKVMDLENVQTGLLEETRKATAAQKRLADSIDMLNSTMGGNLPAVEGYADGGLIRGAGGPKQDNVNINASAGEFMQPVAAVQKYGKDFMERVRNLQVDPGILRAISANPKVISGTGGATQQKDKQVAIFKLGDATITTEANVDAVKQFQGALKIMALKKGRTA